MLLSPSKELDRPFGAVYYSPHTQKGGHMQEGTTFEPWATIFGKQDARLQTILTWVVVKELKLTYHNSETILFTIYIYTSILR